MDLTAGDIRRPRRTDNHAHFADSSKLHGQELAVSS
jgi:hypothetical protein